MFVPASYHAGKVKQTRLCRRSSVPPQQKVYIVESGLHAKEIEMGTTAESLELWFRLYLLPHMHYVMQNKYTSRFLLTKYM